MAYFPHNTPIDNYAEAYMARCKEIQRLANTDPLYKLPPVPPANDPSSAIVVLDKDENETSHQNHNTHPNISLQDLLLSSPVASPVSVSNDNFGRLPTYEESTDLHITGVSVLREWIDISELDVKRYAQLSASEWDDLAGCGPRQKKRKKNGEKCHVATIETENRRETVKETEKNDVEVVGEINANWADIDVEEEVEECETREECKPEPEENEQCTNTRLESEEGQEECETREKCGSEPEENEQRTNTRPESEEEEQERETRDRSVSEPEQNEQRTNTRQESELARRKTAKETKSSNSSDSSGDKFKCDHCSYSTNWKSNMNKHVVSRHQADKDIRWFQCAHCPYKAKTKEYLRSHLSQVHEQFVTWHKCPKCPLRFKTKAVQKYHEHNIHTPFDEIKWVKCDQCPHEAKSERALKDHKRYMHTADDDARWFRCMLCTYKCVKKIRLKKHMLVHGEWFRCNKCPYKTVKEELWKRHAENCTRRRAAASRSGHTSESEC